MFTKTSTLGKLMYLHHSWRLKYDRIVFGFISIEKILIPPNSKFLKIYWTVIFSPWTFKCLLVSNKCLYHKEKTVGYKVNYSKFLWGRDQQRNYDYRHIISTCTLISLFFLSIYMAEHFSFLWLNHIHKFGAGSYFFKL